jgi:hypothetical protein
MFVCSVSPISIRLEQGSGSLIKFAVSKKIKKVQEKGYKSLNLEINFSGHAYQKN